MNEEERIKIALDLQTIEELKGKVSDKQLDEIRSLQRTTATS